MILPGVSQLVVNFKRSSRVKTFWTFAAGVRLKAFMTEYVQLQRKALCKALFTDITYVPRAFVVRHQQMFLELIVIHKRARAVFTTVRLSTGVNANMFSQVSPVLHRLPAVRTSIASTAVHFSVMPQSAVGFEAFAKQRTTVRSFARVNSDVFA